MKRGAEGSSVFLDPSPEASTLPEQGWGRSFQPRVPPTRRAPLAVGSANPGPWCHVPGTRAGRASAYRPKSPLTLSFKRSVGAPKTGDLMHTSAPPLNAAHEPATGRTAHLVP
jgi:hypothetical protein